jgi:dihydrofolate synthase/folylpolyglutamate synthase
VPHQARACTHAELEALVPPSFKGRVVRSTVAELFPTPQTCTAGGASDTVIVTGSVYLIGEILERIAPGRGPGEGRLQDF